MMFLGGNRPRSSIEIEMEMMKAPKKSISLPQSKCPLTKTIDCIKQSLGAVEVDDSYPMPPQLLRKRIWISPTGFFPDPSL